MSWGGSCCGDIIVDMATSLCSENCVPEGARRGIVTQQVIVSACFQSVNGTANDAYVRIGNESCLPCCECLFASAADGTCFFAQGLHGVA
jgi:ferredoxin-like protein FixX